MRRICLSLAAVAILASPILAQGRRPMGGGGQQGPLQLLANKSVGEELKLTDDQKKKVEEASKANREEGDKLRKDAGITRENIREKAEDLAKINKTLGASADKALSGVLNTEQSKRFSQIRLQQQGIRAFSSEDVQKGLKLNEDQQKKIKEVGEALTKEREDLFKDAGRDPTKFREAMTKMREKSKDAMGKIAATLSAEQKKGWKDMTGEPFEIKFEGGRPGGGQPRRPRTDLN